jgi:hypothetical protein
VDITHLCLLSILLSLSKGNTVGRGVYVVKTPFLISKQEQYKKSEYIIFWHIYPLLCSDHEAGSYIKPLLDIGSVNSSSDQFIIATVTCNKRRAVGSCVVYTAWWQLRDETMRSVFSLVRAKDV